MPHRQIGVRLGDVIGWLDLEGDDELLNPLAADCLRIDVGYDGFKFEEIS
ncbi:MAG TPA: hypothetical protein VH518_08770 [Tepidisphaeraceae bacterium]